MQFGADFYRRRLTQQLTAAVNEIPAVPVVGALASEAAVLAVTDDAEFVRQAYRFFLRRDPDSDGLRYFCEMAETQGRATVISEIKKSDEASQVEPLAGTGAAPPADESEIGPTGNDRNPELADLLGIGDDEAFLTQAYLRTLGRHPDSDGLDHHLERLRDREPREVLLYALATSDEAQQRGLQFTWRGEPWRGPSFGGRARGAMARMRPGAKRRRLHADLRRLWRSQARIEQALVDLRSGQTALKQIVQDVSAAESRLSREVETRGKAVSLSKELSQEFQRLRDAQRALHTAVDSLAAQANARAAAVPRPTVPAGDNIVATLVDGFIIGLPAEEWRLVAYHAFRGVLEPGLTRRFREMLKPGMVVVDVGANFGIYTLIAARHVGLLGRVFSFEPTPRTFGILKDNLQINGFLESGRVQFRRVAITDREGSARFSVYRANSGHNTLFPDAREADVIDVETTTLDVALASAPRVDVIKIDAEGAEPQIWEGMAGTLARNPQICVFLEFAPPFLVRAGQDPVTFLRRIEASGFQIRVVDDETGALRTCTDEQLAAVISVNLMASRATR